MWALITLYAVGALATACSVIEDNDQKPPYFARRIVWAWGVFWFLLIPIDLALSAAHAFGAIYRQARRWMRRRR